MMVHVQLIQAHPLDYDKLYIVPYHWIRISKGLHLGGGNVFYV